jgi:hypothetical protein
VSDGGLTWHPRSVIRKYSPDQVRYARDPRRVHLLTGDGLAAMFPVPEGGIAADEGNGLTTGGLANLAAVITGGGHPLAPGRAVLGVGADATGFDPEQVRLAGSGWETPECSYYRPMDPGYPKPAGPHSLEGQATFTEAEACFEWREWGWAAGPPGVRAHHRLCEAYPAGPPVLVNRKAAPQGYGTKEAGCAWVFKTVIDLIKAVPLKNDRS